MDPPGRGPARLADLRRGRSEDGLRGLRLGRHQRDLRGGAPERSTGGRRNFAALVEKAQGRRRDAATTCCGPTAPPGLQTPLALEDGELVETVRLHADLSFKTDSGKANFVFADWDAVAGPQRGARPRRVEGRGVGAQRPDQCRVEQPVRPRPSAELRRAVAVELPRDQSRRCRGRRGIVNGDLLSIESDNVLRPARRHDHRRVHGRGLRLRHRSARA